MKNGPAGGSLDALGISVEFHPFLTHLSDAARARERMPFIGREGEIEAVMETLLRKLKKGVLLVGKPGVGKTALITELAARINRGRVPANLKGKIVLELALNSLLNSRKSSDPLAKDLEKLFGQIKRHRERVILFLDELQLRSVVGASEAGHLQELVKTHITSRDLPIIAAATTEDFYRHFKSDELIAANFSAIQLNEPEKDEMLEILAGVRPHFEHYYGLRIPRRLFEPLYTMAQRFIPSRAFPDKAIELLDIACSKASLKKARTLGVQFVYQSVASISRLPIGIVQLDPQVHYRCLLDYLKAASVDQADALEEIARIIKLAKLETAVNGLRPQGIFLFLGPAGIGKSFVAARIAEYLFGGVEKLRRIDLAGFKKAADLEKLVGSPDGDAPGLLVQEIENHPFSVLLFENIDEAHPALLHFLGKALTQGELIDQRGKRHTLANIIVILSLSAIGEHKRDSTIGFVSGEPGSGATVIDPKIMSVLDWVDEIIQFAPLQRQHLLQIAAIRLAEMTAELRERHGCRIMLAPGLPEAVVAAAETSGRYAHAVGEFIERDVRLPVMDMVTRTDAKLRLRVSFENKRVKVVSV